MSQRFVRCSHCGLPHPLSDAVCPSTGLAIRRSAPRAAGGAQPQSFGSSRPVPPPAPPPSGRSPVATGSGTHRRNLIGRTIDGKYLFKSVLGEGGMGTVFEAENVALGRTVAVKVLHPQQARKKVAVKRFHQEARAAGKIGHPNICEVYDLGTLDDGAPYLVMERLVGNTLADRIAHEGGLPFEDCIDIVNQVLSGLVAAHEKGIVHRDIKPENVFLTQRAGCPPLVKLLDFGVSKMLAQPGEEELDLTRTGMVMGTPFYMSPEQARGDRNLDARVDLWACGVILYEALTGRRPFVAANYNALLLQILTATPKPAVELRPALLEGFEAILDRAMARAREQRYPSAVLFQRDLATLRSRHFDVSQQPRSPRTGPTPPPPPMVEQRPPPVARPRTRSAYSPPPRSEDPPDPLARLPSLEAKYEDEGFDTSKNEAKDDTSGTHIALDLVGSGESDAGQTDPGADPEATGFEDDLPTEIVHQTWDDETRRRPEIATEILRASRPKVKAPPSIEDTVKIEGDIEAHFAQMHPEPADKPRAPRPRRR